MCRGRLVGILSCRNQLESLAAWQPDAPVKHKVREWLLDVLVEAGLPMHQVNAIVSEGVVQLWGGIESKAQHHAALAAAQATADVKRVDNHLGMISALERVAHGGV